MNTNTKLKIRLIVLIVALSFTGCAAIKKVGSWITGSSDPPTEQVQPANGKQDPREVNSKRTINFGKLVLPSLLVLAVLLALKHYVKSRQTNDPKS